MICVLPYVPYTKIFIVPLFLVVKNYKSVNWPSIETLNKYGIFIQSNNAVFKSRDN